MIEQSFCSHKDSINVYASISTLDFLGNPAGLAGKEWWLSNITF